MATEIGPTVAVADWSASSFPLGMSTNPGNEGVAMIKYISYSISRENIVWPSVAVLLWPAGFILYRYCNDGMDNKVKHPSLAVWIFSLLFSRERVKKPVENWAQCPSLILHRSWFPEQPVCLSWGSLGTSTFYTKTLKLFHFSYPCL